MKLVKICPLCGHVNDPSEFYCQGTDSGGEICGYPLFDVESTTEGASAAPAVPPRPEPVEAAPQSAPSPALRLCLNGHSMEPGDAICLQCGSDPAPASETNSGADGIEQAAPEFPGWEVIGPAAAACGDAQEFLARSVASESVVATICWHPPDYVSDRELHKRLRTLDSPHCARLLDTGESGDRPFEVWAHVDGRDLSDISLGQRSDPDFLRGFVSQVASALHALEIARVSHGRLCPSQVRVSGSEETPHFTLVHLDGATVTAFDLQSTAAVPPSSRYTPPERLIGVHSVSSDWWSLGIMLVEILTGGRVFDGVHERAWLLQVITEGVEIPGDLAPEWRLLLMGLLTRDHNLRWRHGQVSRWLNGETDIAHGYAGRRASADEPGSELLLGGMRHRSAARYALAAAGQEHWDEALEHLASGRLFTWLEDGRLPAERLADARRLASDDVLDADQRLMLVLLLLNENLPLCLRGEVIARDTFPSTAARASAWLQGPLPTRLQRINRELWLPDLAQRRQSALGIARERRVQLEELRFEAASLVADRARLETAWTERRRGWPDSTHSALAHLLSKGALTEAELLVMLGARLDQFRPVREVLQEAAEEARRAEASEFWELEAARPWTGLTWKEIHRILSDRLSDFTRSGLPLVDEWADTFRYEHRLSLSRCLVLLSIPAERWLRPEGGEHWRLLFRFFQRRVLAGIQRGPLLALRVTENSQRIDLTELGTDALPAISLLDHIVNRQTTLRGCDPTALARSPKLLPRLRRLTHTVETYRRETGISALYLGFPLLLRRDPVAGSGERKPKAAPLVLWPVRLLLPEGRAQAPRLAFDDQRQEDEALRLNPALEGLLSRDEKHRLDEAIDELRHRASLSAAQVIEVMRTVSADVMPDLGPLPASPSLPTGTRHRVLNSAVLFLCSFSAQTLAHELRQLEHRPCLRGPLAALLRFPQPDAADGAPSSPEPPSSLYIVTHADPSQKRAALAARQAPGVLIQGPPGTGKSQTIVNIVADSLCRGERVLVVCQKQAALEVVRNRLDAAGLETRIAFVADPARDRRAFLLSLRLQLDAFRQAPAPSTIARQRSEVARQMDRMEAELDSLHHAMTTPIGASGLTYEQVLEALLASNSSGIRLPSLRQPLLSFHHETVRAMAERLGEIAPLWLRARPENSALQVLKPFSTDLDNVTALREALDAFAASEAERLSAPSASSRCFEPKNSQAVTAWLAENETTLRALPGSLLSQARSWLPRFQDRSAQVHMARLDEIVEKAERASEPPSAASWHACLVAVSDQEFTTLKEAAGTWLQWHENLLRLVFPPFWIAEGTLKRLAPAGLNGGGNGVKALLAFLNSERPIRSLCRQLEEIRKALGLPVDHANLRAPELAERARSLCADLRAMQTVVAQCDSCPHRSELVKALKTGKAASVEKFLDATHRGVERAALRQESLRRLDTLASWFDDGWLRQTAARVQDGLDTREWLAWIDQAWPTLDDFQRFCIRARSLEPAETSLLTVVAEKRQEFEALATDLLPAAVEATILREALLAWRSAAEETTPALLLERDEFDRKVRHLAENGERLLQLTREHAATVARPDRVVGVRSRWDDVDKLQGPRARKLREVLEMGEPLGLLELRPVWLATPEAIARLFPLREALFDLVIFDEASQLPVEQALPTLYRARRVAVSGDEKQLPPTRFFSGNFEEEEEEEDRGEPDPGIEDLDEAARARVHRREVKDCGDLLELAGAVLPSESLNIHYRSRYRPLINHSNAAFYEGRLSVPALHPEDEIRRAAPMQLIAVNGVYSAQTNPDEAQAIVKFLRDLWSKPGTPPTLGVVTFNLKQAELILDLLDDLAEEDPAFQAVLERERDRSHLGQDCGFFVKNLENVQGDERDWILFSTTFGRDVNGRFLRNFGAVGQRGGERRLNVATTRSKERIVIFTSMPLAEISDLAQRRRPPETPRDFLQTYLLYTQAISGGRFADAQRWLDLMPRGDGANGNSAVRQRRAFVDRIADHIRSLGHEVETVPADDAFGFDLAVRHPDTGLFALGVECDSPRHPDLIHARDREVWRPSVLRASVPGIHRVWSRLWLAEEAKEKVRLEKAIREALP